MMCHIEVPHEILAEDITVSADPCESCTFMDIIRLGEHVPAMLAEDAQNDDLLQEIFMFIEEDADGAYERYAHEWLREYLDLEDEIDHFPGSMSRTYELGLEDFDYERIVRIYTTKSLNV